MVVCGMAVAWGGCLLMFAGEVRRRSEEEAEFKRLIEDLWKRGDLACDNSP